MTRTALITGASGRIGSTIARRLADEGMRVVDRMPAEALIIQELATPLRRLALPEDVAAAVSAVIHDLRFTTGRTVRVDGGRPLGVS